MQQIVLNIENTSIIPSLRKVLKSIDGVTVVSIKNKKKSGLEEAMEDIENGKVYKADSVDDMFQQILGE